MIRRFTPAHVAMFAALLVIPALAASASALSMGGENNTLEARQFRIDNARLPGRMSARQSVLAWQVTQGTWNGQVLDGLCLVMVQTIDEEGRASSHANCYISHEATLAQREALLGAFTAAQPAGPKNITRIEPAVITLEIEGQTVVLHLGLIG